MKKKNIVTTHNSQLAETQNKTTKASVDCCGGPAANTENACCQLDENKKAEGEADCGCNTAKGDHKQVACC